MNVRQERVVSKMNSTDCGRNMTEMRLEGNTGTKRQNRPIRNDQQKYCVSAGRILHCVELETHLLACVGKVPKASISA